MRNSNSEMFNMFQLFLQQHNKTAETTSKLPQKLPTQPHLDEQELQLRTTSTPSQELQIQSTSTPTQEPQIQTTSMPTQEPQIQTTSTPTQELQLQTTLANQKNYRRPLSQLQNNNNEPRTSSNMNMSSSEPSKRGRKRLPRDENGNIIRESKKTKITENAKPS